MVLGVAGSNPVFHPSQVSDKREVTESKPIEAVGKAEKFAESLRGSDLDRVIAAWPGLPAELRAAILRMIEVDR